MSELAKIPETKNELPTLAELTKDVALAWKNDNLNLLLNQQPPANWVKEHPYIKGYRYLPIDKIEYLLRKIFKQYRIEVLKTGMLLNAVEVTVRVSYVDPVTGEWNHFDGVGAEELQTQKGTGNLKLDMSNINRGAITMALPIAKTVAVKDACDHFGDLFGANLNRKDTLSFQPDTSLNADSVLEELQGLYEELKDNIPADDFDGVRTVIEKKQHKAYKRILTYLNNLKSTLNESENS